MARRRAQARTAAAWGVIVQLKLAQARLVEPAISAAAAGSSGNGDRPRTHLISGWANRPYHARRCLHPGYITAVVSLKCGQIPLFADPGRRFDVELRSVFKLRLHCFTAYGPLSTLIIPSIFTDSPKVLSAGEVERCRLFHPARLHSFAREKSI